MDMEYRKYRDSFYIRMDKGDEIIEKILSLCKSEEIHSCIFNGIGGCGKAEIQTFLPETGTFEMRRLEGMLELVSLNGNVTMDENGEYFHHTHASFAYKDGEEHHVAAGHIKSIMVSYTAEIELRPVYDGALRRKYDAETGTGFWDFA